MHDNLSTTPAARLARLRRLAAKHDLGLHKSRDRSQHLDNLGGFMIVDTGRNAVVAGDRYDLDLDDVADFLADLAIRTDAPSWGVILPATAARSEKAPRITPRGLPYHLDLGGGDLSLSAASRDQQLQTPATPKPLGNRKLPSRSLRGDGDKVVHPE